MVLSMGCALWRCARCCANSSRSCVVHGALGLALFVATGISHDRPRSVGLLLMSAVTAIVLASARVMRAGRRPALALLAKRILRLDRARSRDPAFFDVR